MKLCWVGHIQSSKLDSTSPMFWLEENLILSNILIRGKSNFDDWKCPTQQSFILQEITSWKIRTLGTYIMHTYFCLNIWSLLSNSCFCMSTYELTKIRPSFQKLKLSIKVHNYLEIFYIVKCLWKTNHRMLNQMFFVRSIIFGKDLHLDGCVRVCSISEVMLLKGYGGGDQKQRSIRTKLKNFKKKPDSLPFLQILPLCLRVVPF